MMSCPSVVAFSVRFQKVRTALDEPACHRVIPWHFGFSVLLHVQLLVPESVPPHRAQHVQRSLRQSVSNKEIFKQLHVGSESPHLVLKSKHVLALRRF